MVIERLHRDERGLASVDFILSAPILLFVLILVFDAGKYESAKQSTLVLNRTAVWSRAGDGVCIAKKNFQDLVDKVTTVLPVICGKIPYGPTSSGFWQGLDNAGGESLTGTTRRAASPDLVRGTLRSLHNFHPRLGFAPFVVNGEYWMLRRQTWTSDDDAMKAGYDREAKARFNTVGSFINLFPNVFPGAGR
jgi:hypothetical protein